LKERMKLGAGRCRSDEARAKAANIRLEDWMKLSDKQKNYADVARLFTWKVCGELEGTGKTEEEWNAMSIKERARLGVERTFTWEVCSHLVAEEMTEEEWNALPSKERMKLGVARTFTWEVCSHLVAEEMTEEEWNALPSKERMKLGDGRCRTDEARAKAARMSLDDWMKLSDKQKNYADVERTFTWKAYSGKLEGTGKTEEE
jgi:hypothetical protein